MMIAPRILTAMMIIVVSRATTGASTVATSVFYFSRCDMSVLCFFGIAGRSPEYLAGLVHVSHFRGSSSFC